ncbi:MAG: ATP-dependent helicase, partial [Lachnospiraceae bacterium]|nr:ATP-dependent helicase [Lachnospiraceae bacterium]
GENSLIFEFLMRIHREEAAYYSLGLSAPLPSGDAGRMLTKVIGPCVYSYGMAKAAELETVCPFDIFHISLSFQESEQDEYDELTGEMTYCFTRLRKAVPSIAKTGQKERFEELKRLSAGADKRLAKLARTYMNLTYKRKSLVCMASARVSCAEKLISLFNSQEKILIFGERIAQAEELYRILARRYPGRVGRCHSKIGELANRNNLERFRTGEYRILITCRALDEGVDIPDASTGIILSGTSAHRQRVQRLGRIIRKNEGKERAALYYLHMEKTAEDACYLPDFQGNRVYELFYDSKKNNFLNPPYMAAARQVLEDFRRKGVNENTFREICRCLDKGCVRGDWTSAAELLDRRADEARGTAERNYWICMKKVREKV